MTPAPPRKKPSRKETLERERERQRAICIRLLKRFVPLATEESLALCKEGRNGPVIDEESLESGFKAGTFVLKILERMARLDGLDTAEKKELSVSEPADPAELARRVEAVSPALMQRLRLGDLTKE